MKENVIGNKYGHYRVIDELEPVEYYSRSRNKIEKQRLMLCECDCENHTVRKVRLADLRNGKCNSCGCVEYENRSKGRKLKFNKYKIAGNLVKIYLDDSDLYTTIDLRNLKKVVSGHIGLDKKTGYWYYTDGKTRDRLHHFLFQREVDHADRDKSNNTEENLRPCSRQENMRNRGKNKNNKTGYKGVSETDGKYSAFIGCNKNNLYLGRWNTVEEAAHAYDIAAYLVFGEFAWYNDPERIKNKDFDVDTLQRVFDKIKFNHQDWLYLSVGS